MADVGAIAVVLGLQRHPGSGRCVAPRTDMAALAWALGLRRPLEAVAVADAAHDGMLRALDSYLGLGLDRLQVLHVPQDTDPDDALATHLARAKPALVLMGHRAPEDAQSQLPFTLGHELGMPLVQGVRSLRPDGAGWQVDARVGQAVRRLRSSGPLVAALHAGARPGGLSTFAAARRGRIDRVRVAPGPARPVPVAPGTHDRLRPLPLAPARGASFSERFAMLADRPRVASVVLRNLSPEQAAAEILCALRTQGVGFDGDHPGE